MPLEETWPLYFFISYISNTYMVTVISDIRVTLAPSNVGFWNYVMHLWKYAPFGQSKIKTWQPRDIYIWLIFGLMATSNKPLELGILYGKIINTETNSVWDNGNTITQWECKPFQVYLTNLILSESETVEVVHRNQSRIWIIIN